MLLSCLVFYARGAGAALSVFTRTAFLPLTLLLVLWANQVVALAFFFAAFFNKSRVALVFTLFFAVGGGIISLTNENIYQDTQYPIGFYVWPPFAFYHGLQMMNAMSYEPGKQPFTYKDMTYTNDVTLAMLALTLGTIVYGAVAVYLYNVLPSEFGTRRPWHYPVSDLMAFLSKRQK
ncbi:hypothetical protein HK405_002571, partial [Cladochytrium tenue]